MMDALALADPGILIYLMRQKGYTADQLDRVLNHASGLKGISGYQRICARSWQRSHKIIRELLCPRHVRASSPVLHRCYACQ